MARTWCRSMRPTRRYRRQHRAAGPIGRGRRRSWRMAAPGSAAAPSTPARPATVSSWRACSAIRSARRWRRVPSVA
ncbi:hypothetical protein G6F54_014378 [Rhizopus delemar]|nr:hypothetical protein G6F54_014378 [Rhizopus delemar]